MADKKRLIDANELLRDARQNKPIAACLAGIVDVQDLVNDQPTVYAVEVVRCRDCKHYKSSPYGEEADLYCKYWIDQYWIDWIPTDSDDFCSYGERKDNDITESNQTA